MDQKALGQDPCPWEGSVRKRSLQVWTLALGVSGSSHNLHTLVLGFCTEQTNTYPTGKPTGARGVLEKPPLHSQGVCSAACEGSESHAWGCLPAVLTNQVRPTPHHAWGEIMVKTRSSYAETGKGAWVVIRVETRSPPSVCRAVPQEHAVAKH